MTSQKLDLKSLMDSSQYQDNTDHIRKVKHSVLILRDIQKVEKIKQQLGTGTIHPGDFANCAKEAAPFLYNNYTDLFNRLLENELNLLIMTKLLGVLKQIEDGKVNQHDGSVLVGTILKELYVDSAIKRGEHLDELYEKNPTPPREGIPITWAEYRLQHHPTPREF